MSSTNVDIHKPTDDHPDDRSIEIYINDPDQPDSTFQSHDTQLLQKCGVGFTVDQTLQKAIYLL